MRVRVLHLFPGLGEKDFLDNLSLSLQNSGERQ